MYNLFIISGWLSRVLNFNLRHHTNEGQVTENKEIGIINSLTQLVAVGVFSGETIFLLPLVLAEMTGWVMLGLWIVLNFVGLPLIIKLTDKIINHKVGELNIMSTLKILLVGLSGGLLAFILNLIYYSFISKQFNLNDYKSSFIPIVLTMSVAIMIGELIRIKRNEIKNDIRKER